MKPLAFPPIIVLWGPPRRETETWLSITGESWFDFTLGDNLRYYHVNES